MPGGVNPQFSIPGLPSLQAYGVMVAAGILLATALAWRLSRQRGVRADFALDAVFWAVVCGFIAARLLYIAVSFREWLADPVAVTFGSGGGVFLGGLAGGIGAAALVARRHKVPLLTAFDILAPAVAFAHGMGRIGCVLAGCCYGRVCSPGFPLAISYPRLTAADGTLTGSWPYLDHLQRGIVTAGDIRSLPVYPVQLIEAAFLFLLTAVLLAVFRKRPAPGAVATMYLAAYAGIRFALEFLRGDAERGIIAGLSLSQWLSMLVLAAAVAILARLRRTAAAY